MYKRLVAWTDFSKKLLITKNYTDWSKNIWILKDCRKINWAPYSTLVKHCMKHFMSAHGSHWMAKKRNLAFVIFADRNIIALQTQPPLFSIKEYVNRVEFVKYRVVKSPKIFLYLQIFPIWCYYCLVHTIFSYFRFW